jgi:hypothetical protein
VIISGGENISSVEVEGTLLRHPAVGEAAVVGLPSERWGETPHAFVVLMPGASVTAEELIAFVRDRLAHFKAPREITFVTDLPKTATGKIQKYVLRGGAANLSQQLSPGGRPPMSGLSGLITAGRGYGGYLGWSFCQESLSQGQRCRVWTVRTRISRGRRMRLCA